MLSARGRALLHQHCEYLVPVVRTKPGIFPCIMRSVEQNASSAEPGEVTRAIIDQVIGVNDLLITAKDNVARGNEGKVLTQPLEFGVKRMWDLHGGAGNEDVELR